MKTEKGLTALCYCNSQLSFDQCCQPLLNAKHKAHTAQQLMRSRFSAFCTGNIDYLIATHHPSKHQDNDRQTLNQSVNECQWLQLSIHPTSNHQTSQTLKPNNQDEVEFTATYLHQGQLLQLHEISRFIYENQQWYYLDGVIDEGHSAQINIGRNDLCWCDSGKKFKKCHS